MVDFVALVTPPKLLGPTGKPANGDIYVRSTSNITLADGIVTPFQEHGKIIEGEFKDLDGGPLMLAVTPEGVALDIYVEIVQDGPGGRRDKHRIVRTVSTPNASTVTWDELVDVVPVTPGAEYEVPSWVTQLLTDAALAATPAIDAKNAAEAAAELAIEAAASVPTEAELTATIGAQVTAATAGLEAGIGKGTPPKADMSKLTAWGSSSIMLNTELATLGTAVGASFYNGGKGAEWSHHTAARLGSSPALLTFPNDTIPASGAVIVSAVSAVDGSTAIPPSSNWLAYTGTVKGVAGTISSTNSAITFTRTTAGAAVAVTPKVEFTPKEGSSRRDHVAILNLGKNNMGTHSGQANLVLAHTAAAYAYFEKALVVSNFHDTNSAATGLERDQINQVNAALRARYGDHYIDVSEFLTSPDLWAVTGITPTSEDLAQQAAGNKPPSVSADPGHLNAIGYHAVRVLIQKRIEDLGWYDKVLNQRAPVSNVYAVDAFTESRAELAGSATEAPAGVTRRYWQVAPAGTLAVSGGNLVPGSSAALGSCGFPVVSPKVSIEVRLAALPTGANLSIWVRRNGLAGADQYRIVVTPAGVGALVRRAGGADSQIGGVTIATEQIVAGDVLRLSQNGTTLSFHRNGVLVGSAVDGAGLLPGTHAGISKYANAVISVDYIKIEM